MTEHLEAEVIHDFRSRKSILDHLVAEHQWTGLASDHFRSFLPELSELQMLVPDGRFAFDTSELMAIHRELHQL
jgi:hypothetical protein